MTTRSTTTKRRKARPAATPTAPAPFDRDTVLTAYGLADKGAHVATLLIWPAMQAMASLRDEGMTLESIGSTHGIVKSTVSGTLTVYDLIASGDVAEPRTTSKGPNREERKAFGLPESGGVWTMPADGEALISLRSRLRNKSDQEKAAAIIGAADAPLTPEGLRKALGKPLPRVSQETDEPSPGVDFRQWAKMTGGALATRMSKDAADNEYLTPDQVIQVLADYAHAVMALGDDVTGEDRKNTLSAALGKAIAKHGARQTRKARASKAL